MKKGLLEHIVCPKCRTPLELESREEDAGQVRTGMLHCATVEGHRFPVTRFVPRFVDEDEYADSFSKQRLYVRRHFNYYENDRSGDGRFTPSTGFSREDVRSGLCLEVGCGYGRYLDVVQRLGGTIIGVDLSTHSIDLAQDFVGLRDGVHLVQCDLFELPFRENHFSNVFSLGVLHHTPNTKDAYSAIVPFVRPGGRLSIWVYHPRNKIQADQWRIITTRLPHSLLYYSCIANQALFSWIRALPGGRWFNRLIPGTSPRAGRHFWMRVLGDFDNLSPRFAHSHTPEEVCEWFAQAGLKDVKPLEMLTSVTGVKC